VEMVLVPEGEFQMGGGDSKTESDQLPVHTVYLDAYYIDKFEVSNKLFQACVDDGGCKKVPLQDYPGRKDYYGSPYYADYPVVFVNWDMSEAYCEWRGARLPTEAQWEKATRGPKNLIYSWGNEAHGCDMANLACNSGTVQVGISSNDKSPFGVFDMAGNVREWVADLYSNVYYMSGPSRDHNPLGPADGDSRVYRGGSWSSNVFAARTFQRARQSPSYNSRDLGFRCGRDISP